MKNKVVLMMCLMVSMGAMADGLTAWIQGDYKAQVMTESEMDSVFALSTATEAPRYRLEYENKKSIFRRSFEADWYVIDTRKNTRTHLSDEPVRNAVLSPNNRYVVYSKHNNLYIFKLDYMTEVSITSTKDLINGTADWLYEEEFGVTGMVAFSPDSKQIAFVQLDDRGVSEFAWQTMLDEGMPQTHAIRYPRVGTTLPKVNVCVYDIYYKTIKTMNLGSLEDSYVPRIAWTNPVAKGKEPAEPQLVVEKMNRDQNEMSVYMVNPKSTVSTLFYQEKSDRYFVDYSLFNQWQWLNDGRVIIVSEKEDWRQLYLLSAQGKQLRCLSPEGMDVTQVYGVDETTQTVYYQAAPNALTRQCYAVDLKKGTNHLLTEGEGVHSLTLSPDKKQAIENYHNHLKPNVFTLYDLRGTKMIRRDEVMNNDEVAARWQQSGMSAKNYFRLPTERGDELDAWMILPSNFDANNRYPVVLMHYSGPASQQVIDRWRIGFGHYLASQGYVVINADPRGTDCRGRKWRNETYMHLGQKEAEDQLSVARYAATLPYVDSARIAMIGWSYGGYQTIRTMCEPSSIIRCGVAIAPVTDWTLYDAAYTERFMRRAQVNESGYEKASLIPMAKQLNGQLLIVHGLADDNVHAQNTFLLVDALVQAGKQFDMQVYPDDNHFMRQRANYEHLHRRILRFLAEYL